MLSPFLTSISLDLSPREILRLMYRYIKYTYTWQAANASMLMAFHCEAAFDWAAKRLSKKADVIREAVVMGAGPLCFSTP